MKKIIYSCGIGALLGTVIVAWLSPSIISWYFTPPADLVVSCKASVDWGIHTYRKASLIGGLAGFILGAIFYFVVIKNKKIPAATTATK